MKTNYVIRLRYWTNIFIGKHSTSYAITSDQKLALHIKHYTDKGAWKLPKNHIEQLKQWGDALQIDAYWFTTLDKARIYTSINSVRKIFSLYHKVEDGVVPTFNQYEIVELQIVRGNIVGATEFLNDTKPVKKKGI